MSSQRISVNRSIVFQGSAYRIVKIVHVGGSSKTLYVIETRSEDAMQTLTWTQIWKTGLAGVYAGDSLAPEHVHWLCDEIARMTERGTDDEKAADPADT